MSASEMQELICGNINKMVNEVNKINNYAEGIEKMKVEKVNGEEDISKTYQNSISINRAEERTDASATSVTSLIDDRIKSMNEEVMSEFTTSKDELYKEALRSLIMQENAYIKQANEIQKDLQILADCKSNLEIAFKNGDLISREDCLNVVERTRSNEFFRGEF